MDAFSWLVALTLRCTVVLSVALGLGLLLRRSSAVARHRLLTLTDVSLLALPALPWRLPSLELPLALPSLEPSSPAPLADLATPAETMEVLGEHGEPKPGPAGADVAAVDDAPTSPGIDYKAAFAVAAVVVWLIGVAAALVRLGRALLHQRRLLAASRPLDGSWFETLDEIRRALAIARPVRLLMSDATETPLTCGWPRPAVFLPPIAECWPEDRRRLVMQHKLVHVVHGDGLRRGWWPRPTGSIHWPGSPTDRPGWSANRPTRPWFDSGRSRRSTPATWWRSQRSCAAARRSSRAPCLWSSATSSKGESS